MFKGKPVTIPEPGLGSYVMEQILFKISYPAEFHAQTAVEAAIKLYPRVKSRLDQIKRIVIETQESGKRIIDKSGPLNNPADRDHCIQYMVAVPLIKGSLTAEDYENDVAADPRIDHLRLLMEVIENRDFTIDYLDPEKRSIGNSVQVFFQDGSSTDRITVEYPIGHRRRREEGIPVLIEKFQRNLRSRFSEDKSAQIMASCADQKSLESLPVDQFMQQFVDGDAFNNG